MGRIEAFKKWMYEREFLLESEEERKLKAWLVHSQHRSTVDSIRRRRNEIKQLPNYEPISATAAASEGDAAMPTNYRTVTDAAYHDPRIYNQQRRCENPKHRRRIVVKGEIEEEPSSLSMLSRSTRLLIFQFVPVVSQRSYEDIRRINEILNYQDAEVLRQPDGAVDMLHVMGKALDDTHVPLTGDVAVMAACLGLDARDKVAHGDFRLLSACIRKIKGELAVQVRRHDRFATWAKYRERVLHAPCAKLRHSLRHEMERWAHIIAEWRDERHDVVAELATTEHEALAKRVSGVEYLGSPDLELDDVRNMFWEMGLTMPQEFRDAVTTEYTQSLTFAQVMTLGFADIPWVRGFAWEERTCKAPELPHTGDGATATTESSGAVAPLVGRGTPPPRPSAQQLCASPGADLLSKLAPVASSGPTEEQIAKQLDEENRAAEEQRRLEEEKKKRAHQEAADRMTQRLWISTIPFQQRVQHRFTGCEICSGLPIDRVGLKKSNAGTCDDVGLCAECFTQHYSLAASRVINAMYEWYDVRTLIDEHEQKEQKEAPGAVAATTAALDEGGGIPSVATEGTNL